MATSAGATAAAAAAAAAAAVLHQGGRDRKVLTPQGSEKRLGGWVQKEEEEELWRAARC